jgi:hypothetical protein
MDTSLPFPNRISYAFLTSPVYHLSSLSPLQFITYHPENNWWDVQVKKAHPAFSPMGTGGPFSGGKARQGRDADHSPPSSAEVVNE